MKLLGYRYVTVSENSDEMVDFFENKLGLSNDWKQSESYQGGIFKSGDSWLEFWQKSEGMPEMTMLQLVVDDADAFANHAKENGLDLHGPMNEHGEKIYSLKAPNGMPVTIQSSVKDG